MNRRHSLRFIMVLMVTWIFVWPAPSIAQQSSSDHAFGIVGGYWRPEASNQLGVSWDVITFDWQRFQPNGPGDFVADAVRPLWIEQSLANNRQVVGVLINTPAWASEQGTPNGVPTSLYRSSADPENFWALFVDQIVTEFAPRGVHHWVIWDNIDIAPSEPGNTFAGDVSTYAQMLRIAHQVMRAQDEEVRIFVGGQVWWNDVAAERIPYLQRLIDEIADDDGIVENNYYFDGVGVNILVQPALTNGLTASTDGAYAAVQGVRQTLDNNNLADKEVWVLALNASPTADEIGGLPTAAIQTDVRQQADFVVQGSALALAAGAARVAIYRLFDANMMPEIDPPYGLIRFDNSLRPAFNSYQQVVGLLQNSTQVSFDNSTNARLVTFEQPDRHVYLMWSANTTPVSFWVEARFGDSLQLLDVFGNDLPAPRQSVGPGGVSVHVIDTPAVDVPADQPFWISGSPRILVMRTTDDRDVWASLGDAIGVQLR